MNKDVIYIEPQDDITDIITKIEGSKEKIVALVPPKKASVFRSIVNIKLISKAGASAGKTVVIVTTDPSIVKLAATTKLPVTKDLKSAPAVPELDTEAEISTTSTAQLDNDSEDMKVEEVEAEADSASEATDETAEDKAPADDADEKTAGDTSDDALADDDSAADDDDSTDKKTSKKPTGKLASSKNKFLRFIGTHKKLSIGLGVGAIALVFFAIWALAIAPAVTLTVVLRTTTGNFSENITFTENLSDENVSEGKFFIEEKKYEMRSETEFEATGQKNVGKKASGSVVVYNYFPITGNGGKVAIAAGTIFTHNGLGYVADKDASISWDGDLEAMSKDCENYGEASLKISGCMVSTRVAVTAKDSGEKFNISAANSGWSTNAQVGGVYSDAAMSGGTDETVTVVQQSDIEKALASLSSVDEATNKEKLLDSLEDDDFPIDSSFKQTTGEAVSTPAVGEEVKGKAKLSVTTTDTIFVIDATKLKEYIRETAKLPDNYTIYSMNDPFIENFMKTDSGYTGKLKTSYVSGVKLTENDVIETVRGKGLGAAQHDINSAYDGIKQLTIDTSVPWVMTIPNNPERITVIIKQEE